MIDLTELTELAESISSRARELYARLDGEDRALFHALMGETADVITIVKDLL